MAVGDPANSAKADGGSVAPAPHTLTYAPGVSAGPPVPAQLPSGPAERYVVGAEIARGGMGMVLQAEDRSLLRRVAVKVMRQSGGDAGHRLQRFVAEARVTGQLEHPGVVPVYELGTDAKGRLFYAMKRVQGTTLGTILDRLAAGDAAGLARYSLSTLLTVFLKVCDAVAFAHSRGVIHRDLKPDNIMVGDYGEVLVLDWGLAKVARSPEHGARGEADAGQPGDPGSSGGPGRTGWGPGEAPALTLEGEILGTPAYMAPEQARGDIGSIDARTDVYALGAILYAVLALRAPVAGDTVEEVLRKVTSGKIIPPACAGSRRTKRPASEGSSEARAPEPECRGSVSDPSLPHCPGGRVPGPLSRVAMKAMALAPADRYQSVPELQADVEAWRGGFATAAEEASLWRQLGLLVRRHRVVAMAAMVTSLGLAIGLGMALVQWRRAVASEACARASEREAVASRQKERSTSLAAAERFARQAIRSAETAYWDEAERRVQDAEMVSPDGPWAAYARGVFASMKGDYATAAKRFREAQKADPTHAESAAGLAEALSRQGQVEEALALAAKAVDLTDWRALLKAGQALFRAGRARECQAPLARALELMEQEKDAGKGQRTVTSESVQDTLDHARARLTCEGFREEVLSLPAQEQVSRVQAKLSEINGFDVAIVRVDIRNGEWVGADIVEQPKLRFIYPLAGVPLQRLSLCTTAVSDLSPLAGMPLRDFTCNAIPASDFSPLRGMPLKRLDFAHCANASDLSFLEGMPLRDLGIGGRRVSDLSIVRGRPLWRLALGSVAVRDLGVLRGMPLTHLDVRAVPVSDLSPLEGMRLTRLFVTHTEVRDLSPLRGMPLTGLDCDGSPVSDLSPLKNMPIEELNLRGCSRVSDLSPLRGMPIATLCCNGTSVSDLSPLAGMPLTTLECSETPVSDLSPLQGMPLETLGCFNTGVSDLSPLRGAPLTGLQFSNTPVCDLSPLSGMNLKKIGFTPKSITKGMEVLRQMKGLTMVTLTWSREAPGASCTPAEFWKRYDAGEFR